MPIPGTDITESGYLNGLLGDTLRTLGLMTVRPKAVCSVARALSGVDMSPGAVRNAATCVAWRLEHFMSEALVALGHRDPIKRPQSLPPATHH